MDTKTNLLQMDLSDAVIKLKRDLKAFECLAEIADAASVNKGSIALELLVPLLDNLTVQLKQNIERLEHIIKE